MNSPEAAVEDFRRRLLRFDAGAERILQAAGHFPDSAEVQLAAAALHLYGQTDANTREAAEFLESAERCGAHSSSPELLRGLHLWHDQQYGAAALAFEALTERVPEDLLPAKYSEYLYYIMGQQYSGQRYLRHMQRLESAQGSDPDYLSMYSFAWELCDEFGRARELAEKSLTIEPRNPWAEHTLSHVTIRQGDIEEGESRLRAFLPMARTCSRPVHSHTAWHLGLFDLERLDFAEAMRVYHAEIWGFSPEMIGEQVDAIALLWRLELAGGDASQEWGDLAGHVDKHIHESYMPFVSAHHAYALARAGWGESGLRLLATVQQRAQKDALWRDVGSPIVQASFALGESRWSDAIELMAPAIGSITAVGGSDAQDDLFRQAWVVALARSGRRAEAGRFLADWSTARKPTALQEYFFALS